VSAVDDDDFGFVRRPAAVFVTDFDADGCSDLVRTGWRRGEGGLHWSAGRCNGDALGSFETFASGRVHDRARISAALGAALDGAPGTEVVLVDESLDRIVIHSVANGAQGVSCAVGDGPRAVAAADFDGDTDVDLAVANQRSRDVSILLGDGTGGCGTSSRIVP
jgi:hypothetical protein